MELKKHAASAVVAAIVGALAGAGSQHLVPAKVVEKQTQVKVFVSKGAWPDLNQDETIAVGEKLKAILKGVNVSIFCNDSACDALAHDLDDAMQIADVGSTLEKSVTPIGRGFSIIAPPGDQRAEQVAEAIKAATAGKLSPQVRSQAMESGSILIAIGGRQR